MAPRSSNRSVYLPDDLWAFLDAEVERSGAPSVNSIVRIAVTEHRRIVEHLQTSPKNRTAPPSPPVSLGRPRAAPGSLLKKGRGS